jgi:hypothetical protein
VREAVMSVPENPSAALVARPRWATADMKEPWHRDLMVGLSVAHTQTPDDLRRWAERVAFAYSEWGSLEVTACVLALLDALDAEAEASERPSAATYDDPLCIVCEEAIALDQDCTKSPEGYWWHYRCRREVDAAVERLTHARVSLPAPGKAASSEEGSDG